MCRYVVHSNRIQRFAEVLATLPVPRRCTSKAFPVQSVPGLRVFWHDCGREVCKGTCADGTACVAARSRQCESTTTSCRSSFTSRYFRTWSVSDIRCEECVALTLMWGRAGLL